MSMKHSILSFVLFLSLNAQADDFVTSAIELDPPTPDNQATALESEALEQRPLSISAANEETHRGDFYSSLAEQFEYPGKNRECWLKTKLLLGSAGQLKHKFEELQHKRKETLNSAKAGLELQMEIIDKVKDAKEKNRDHERLYSSALEKMQWHRDRLRDLLADYEAKTLQDAFAQQKKLKSQLAEALAGTKGDGENKFWRAKKILQRLVSSGEICGTKDHVFVRSEVKSQYNDFGNLFIPSKSKPFSDPVISAETLISGSGSLEKCRDKFWITHYSRIDLTESELLKVLGGSKPVTVECIKHSPLTPSFMTGVKVDPVQRSVKFGIRINHQELKAAVLKAAGY